MIIEYFPPSTRNNPKAESSKSPHITSTREKLSIHYQAEPQNKHQRTSYQEFSFFSPEKISSSVYSFVPLCKTVGVNAQFH